MDFSTDQLKIFSSLPKKIIRNLAHCATQRNIEAGDFLILENEKRTSFYIIEEGELEILENQIKLGVLRKGDILGEASLSGGASLVSARALGPVVVIEISMLDLAKKLSPSQIVHIKSAIFERELDKLSRSNRIASLAIKQNLEAGKANELMGRFIIYLLTLVFIYVFVLQAITILKFNPISSSVISIPSLLIFGSAILVMMKKSGYPLSTYGFNLKGGVKALVESSLITIPILIALVLLKWSLIHTVHDFSHLKLFHISSALNRGAPKITHLEAGLLVSVYILFVPVQEFIYRGGIQSSLQLFLTGKNKTLQAILVSNIPFCMIHFHLSIILVVLTYFFGLILGWIYARQKTLIGSCFCHFIVGLFAFFILGIQDIFIY